MRDTRVDAFRGFAMVLVVLGHAIQFGSHGRISLFENPLFVSIYAFHMPAFALVIGYVLASSVDRSPAGDYFWRRTTSLFVPFVAWVALVALARNSLGRTADSSATPEAILRALYEPGSTVWFLWFAFCASMMLFAVRCVPRRWRVAVLAALAGALFAVPLDSEFAVEQLRWLFPFVAAGYLLRARPDLMRILQGRVALFSAVPAALLCLLAWTPGYSVYVDGSALPGGDAREAFFIWIFRYVFATAGIIIAASTVRALARTRGGGVLAELGRSTLGIYCVQTALFAGVAAAPPVTSSVPLLWALVIPALACVVLGLSYVSTAILERFKVTRVTLLGGRGAGVRFPSARLGMSANT